jgi:phosphonate transport system substrate-binding protein
MRAKSRTSIFRFALFLFATILISVPAEEALAKDPITLTFGIYTSVKPTAMIKKFRPLTKAIENEMSESLKRPVNIRFKVAPSYEAGITNITSGQVDFARFGPVSYIEALKENDKIALLAAESKKGSKIAQGIICVRENSPIKSISDLKGKSFAFGSELSTIGRYLSQFHLLENGVNASSLSEYEYLGRHDAVGAAVGAGRFDAGALKEKTFNKLKSSGTALRELARFPNAPQSWIAREGLAEDVQSALRNALFSITDKTALSAINADALVAGDTQDYVLVRTAMEKNEEFFQ